MTTLRAMTMAPGASYPSGEPSVRRWAIGSDEPHTKPCAFGLPQKYAAHAQIGIGTSGGGAIRAIKSGWACLARTLVDGRRQIQHVLVPGDLLILKTAPAYGSHLVAITPVTVVQGGRLDDLWVSAALQRGLGAIHEQMLNQIVRLGRQNAYERVAHLFLELRDRLMLAGIGDERHFTMPLTQELLADVLGLTSVHVNRTLQQMRRDGLIVLSNRTVTLPEPDALARIADYHRPPRT